MGIMLIVKAGKTLPSLRESMGDFEHWILSGMRVHSSEASIVDVRRGSKLPGHDDVSGIVVTGSHAMVTEHRDWSERTAKWLAGAVDKRIPILGICYGHQLLAYALGGEVGDNPRGPEFGTVEVKLNENARADGLFSGFPSSMRLHMSHIQSVLRLPDNAKLLASSAEDANQAFVVGDSAWGVQFHPEYNAEMTIKYIEYHRELLLKEGKDPDRLIKQCADTPYGFGMLKRFADIINEKV